MMPATQREALVAEAVLDLAHRTTNFDLLDLLYDLTEHALALLPAQGAGVTVLDSRGRVTYATASDERCRELEEVQVDLGEGPCLDSARSQETLGPVVLDPGADAQQWPRFSRYAHQVGITAISAVPLHTNGIRLGALNLMNAEPPLPTPLDLRVAQSLATAAATSFHYQYQLRGQDEVLDQLQQALHGRIVIEQAKGMLSERFTVSVDQAFTRMRESARTRGLTLSEIATQVAYRAAPVELNLP